MLVGHHGGVFEAQDLVRDGDTGLRRVVVRFFALQIAASLGLGVCVAYAYGPSGPVPYADRIDFALRLGDEIGALPERALDGLRLRFGSAD